MSVTECKILKHKKTRVIAKLVTELGHQNQKKQG